MLWMQCAPTANGPETLPGGYKVGALLLVPANEGDTAIAGECFWDSADIQSQ